MDVGVKGLTLSAEEEVKHNGEIRQEEKGGRDDNNDGSDASSSSDVDVVNWEQLERELYARKKSVGEEGAGNERQSRLLDTLNLREEIRRQLADGEVNNTGSDGVMHKSKSGFLDESSSESDEEIHSDQSNASTDAASDGDEDDTEQDRDFYLNKQFSPKIGLRKAAGNGKFNDSTTTINQSMDRHNREKGMEKSSNSHMVVRPLQSRPSFKTRLRNQKDLQICFLNDFPPARTSTPSSGRSSTESSDRLAGSAASSSSTAAPASIPEGPSLLSKDFWSPPAEATTSRHVFHSLYMPKSRSMFEMDTEKQRNDRIVMGQFEQAQAKWRHEMQLKIQLSHQQIHLQSQRQRRRHKKSPITTKISLPHGKTRLDRPFLSDIPVPHLQIILNDLLEQIENLNDGLVQFLEERDELHMEQDSKLVDIDDLSRRLKEQWMVNWKRRNMANTNLTCLEDSEELIRAYDERNAGRSKNANTSRDGDREEGSSPAAPTTPTSQLNNLKNNFRQRIKSLLS